MNIMKRFCAIAGDSSTRHTFIFWMEKSKNKRSQLSLTDKGQQHGTHGKSDQLKSSSLDVEPINDRVEGVA